MKRSQSPSTQQGIALWMLLILVAIGSGYAFYRNANLQHPRTVQEATLVASMVRAKEALIARAATDSNRPGSLPCPDLITNNAGLSNIPGDGKSDLFTLTQCPSYVGWLPWVTLDLPELADDTGTRLWYVLSPNLRDDDSAPPINSDTAMALNVDGNTDIAALIIAPRAPLGQQNRPSNNPSDYLDSENGNGDAKYLTGPQSDSFNDMVMVITRQELMAAVEQRIANELRSCLAQHAASPDNPQHTYPWPAPLSNSIFKGKTKSLFGMVSDTQPGSPEMSLKDSITKLTNLKNSLIFPSTAADTSQALAALANLQAQAAYARALFDRLFLAALDLNEKASSAQQAFTTLDAAIVAATSNKSVFLSKGGTIPTGIQTALPSLTALIDSLKNGGFDLFLEELQNQNLNLKSRLDAATAQPTLSNFNKLITPINLFKNTLLDNSWTPNTEIENKISAAYTASINAATTVNAARVNLVPLKITAALQESGNLYAANQSIETSILANRVNIDSEEVDFRAKQLASALNSAIAAAFSPQALATLASALESTSTLIQGLSATNFEAARSNTLSALTSALGAAKAGNDANLIQSSTENAANLLKTLASALASNGDNVALETLKAVATTLDNAQQAIPANITAARALRTPTSLVNDWSAIAITQSDNVAGLARKGIVNGAPAEYDSATSAYTAANKLLASLDGSTGSLALLEALAKDPSAEASAKAKAAFDETLSLLNDLLNAANQLDGSLETGMAEAGVPTSWFGTSCAFLRPSTGTPTWWTANGWKNLFFYQISDRIVPVTGQLTINGSGNHKVVTLSAGKALTAAAPAQNRNNRKLRNYLEKKNADLQSDPNIDGSRDGDAQSPITQFVLEAISPKFNDRLAY